jgi:hypothetical protein
MKKLYTLAICFIALSSAAQVANREYNQSQNGHHFTNEAGITASATVIGINCKVVYNAIPDGYFATYTTSFIGNTVEEVEIIMNDKIEKLIHEAHELDIEKDDILIDIISLDPIFDIYQAAPNATAAPVPSGYKITQNITFNLANISQFRALSVTCMNNGIYDVIATRAYLNSSKEIYDTLALKAVEVLNHKKKLAADIGCPTAGGTVSFVKTKDVIYPSERYLKSHLKNSSLYKHHLSQNATIDVHRKVEVDNYFTLDLKDADFVFNASETKPVIQFFYHIKYSCVHPDTEAEMREQIREELESEYSRTFYVLDSEGRLQPINLNH